MNELNKKMYIMICALILLLPLLLFPQDKIVLTLEESVKLALENNPAIQIAEKELAKARAGIWEAYSAILPSIDGRANFQRSWDIQQNTIPNFMKFMLKPQPGTLPPEIEAIFNTYTDAMPDYVQLSFGLENTFMYGATLTQPLFLGGAGIAGIQIAYAARRASEYNLESNKQNLIYQTTNTFYAVLLAKQLMNVQQEALAQAQANLDNVTKKYEVGTASGFDKMRAEVELANLSPAVISAKNNYQSALTGLRMVLGLPRTYAIEIEGELNYIEDEFGSVPYEEILTLAKRERPEIHMLQQQKSIASKGKILALSQFMPKLFFQTDYSFMAMKNDLNFKRDDFSKGFTSAISLQIPIFHSFRNTKEYQKAQLDYNIVLDAEKQILDGITAEVEMTQNKFLEAKQKYQAANESVALAKEALRLANLMYDEGASTQLDVLNSQLALNQSRLNYVSSLYEYQMARYQLRKVTGTLQGIL
ncbi:TolC family protein [bacterium]|nr:TolC family protein [bacterium]